MNPTVEPRSVGIATDKELEEMVRSFSLDQVYRDDDAEEARRLQKKQQEALLQEQRNAAAKEADRRARTKSFPDRTFDVLGIRIGMTKDEARAALLASDSTYAIRDNDPSISFYSQSKCDFPWRELIKKLPKRAGDAAAERLLSGDKPGGTPTTNATIPEELLSELPPECRKSDLAWIEVGFTGSRKLADGTTDRVTVYMPGNGSDRTVKAVVRELYSGDQTWAGKQQFQDRFAAALREKYGTELFEGRKGASEYGKYWFATSEMHNKAEFDTTFAGRCLQYYLHMHYFRSPCSVIIAHRAPYGDMYMADTTFFYEQREAMQRWEADLKQNSKERIKF